MIIRPFIRMMFNCKFAKGAASPVKLIYDFGGCEAGVDFVIANITIIKK